MSEKSAPEEIPQTDSDEKIFNRVTESPADLKDIGAGLARAQEKIKPAQMNAENPFHKSKYADLASVIKSIKEPLAKEGISIMQSCNIITPGTQPWIECTTTLIHKSGQKLVSTCQVPLRASKGGYYTPQDIGASMTYARRYGVSAAVGVANEDTDGEVPGVYRYQEDSQKVKPPAESEKQVTNKTAAKKPEAKKQEEAEYVEEPDVDEETGEIKESSDSKMITKGIAEELTSAARGVGHTNPTIRYVLEKYHKQDRFSRIQATETHNLRKNLISKKVLNEAKKALAVEEKAAAEEGEE